VPVIISRQDGMFVDDSEVILRESVEEPDDPYCSKDDEKSSADSPKHKTLSQENEREYYYTFCRKVSQIGSKLGEDAGCWRWQKGKMINDLIGREESCRKENSENNCIALVHARILRKTIF